MADAVGGNKCRRTSQRQHRAAGAPPRLPRPAIAVEMGGTLSSLARRLTAKVVTFVIVALVIMVGMVMRPGH